ncbi:deoxyribodipyrimidine photo-lyase [Limibaculum sp. M0105]|uniref:Deoxyribodipyrimidine photo-lyase n=1 Tax=Thermohalobaculum xanthum TaxID=2753746 RepID=A0A8J7M630_9RHOB|nr:FAD-binding domain-containing protein [Thermohalobaculum xanthum]MBK0398933.1 deoxyribodipyrimidine photo-lyase [Thermohalobaculum xanthum]
MALGIVWFKRDLRVDDHEPLARAAQAGPVIPLYIVEPRLWQQRVASARQWRFVAGAVSALAEELGHLGAPLVVRTGDAVDVLESLRRALGPFSLWSHQETGDRWTYDRDLRVAAWARGADVVWHEFQAGGVIRKLRTRDGWAARWDAAMARPLIDRPTALAPHGLASEPLPDAADLCLEPDPCDDALASPEAGRALLASFLGTRGRHYRREMSSPVTAFDACSRLSPHLAWGTLSTREIWQRARTARADCIDRAQRASIDSFTARLHWRCHFMQKLEDEPAIETRCMHPLYEGLREGEHDEQRLRAWLSGETGLPMVDACMRALRATGWLNFRMRAMLVSVAAYHLWLDWRRFGPGLAQLFTDFEPGIHWSQCQMQSGTTGINTLRVYNPVKQSHDQDPKDVFLRRWLPQLSRVPAPLIHEPWKMTPAQQAEWGCRIGRDYPAPLVDHVAAARMARDRVHARRREQGFAEAKQAVLARHASRRPTRGTTRPRRPARKADSQQSFDF